MSAESIPAMLAKYYDSLSDDEVAEQKEWGDFALREFTSLPPELGLPRIAAVSALFRSITPQQRGF